VVIDQMKKVENTPFLPSVVRSISKSVADQVPSEVWEVVEAVTARCGEAGPTLQLLSEEPYIPWELAEMPTPPFPDAERLLGAQLIVGRWVLGERRPPQPPPHQHEMRALAVLTGDYAQTSQATLECATREADWVAHTLGAERLNATVAVVLALFERGGGDLIHFAVHGSFHDLSESGLILADGWTLTDVEIGGVELTGHPLIVLNACQVGQGTELLGDYAGIGAAFLRAGASAVVAPIWSIGDQPAEDFCRAFYELLCRGQSPALALRALRRGWVAKGATTSTPLAYLFLGHPSLELAWGENAVRELVPAPADTVQ
jgi:hypothetical protein